jgi:agmatinase
MSTQRDPLPVFSGIPTFCRLPRADRESLAPGMAAIAGVAFDHTCTARIGSRFGPRSIRETSLYFAGYGDHGARVEVSTDQLMAFSQPARVVDIDDLNIYPADVPRTEAAVADGVAEIVSAGAFPVILGGDEYLALPVLRGFAHAWQARGAPGVGYLQVSGHLALGDRHPTYGQFWGGATARRIIESGTVDPQRMAWLGPHGRCRGEEWDRVQQGDLWVRPLGAVRRDGLQASAAAALARAGAGGGPVLVSLDMSVLDGAFAPGTAEPGFEGLTNTELLMLMDALAREPAQGLVLTGVNPRIEPTWTAERLAATAVLRFLAPRFLQAADAPAGAAGAAVVA